VKVAFLSNVIAPYRVPLFEELAATPGWQLCVFVNAGNEFDRSWSGVRTNVATKAVRSWSFRRTVATGGASANRQTVELHLPLSLLCDLRQFRPDVVISLELGPRSLTAAAYCRLHGIPLVLWSYQARTAMHLRGLLRRLARRILLGRRRQIVGMGTQAREVLTHFGAAPDCIHDSYNAPDVDAIHTRLQTPESIAAVRAIRSRFANQRLCVVVGRLVPVKAVDRTLRAWMSLAPEQRAAWRLVFVGDGPLADLVRGKDREHIHHVGRVPAEQVPDWLRAADLHLFASLGDVWGLVTNEAMLCGTPTMCSIHAGCADDAIRDGIDGWLFDPTDEADWVDKLGAVLARDDFDHIGERARRSAARFDVATMATAFRGAVRDACEARSSERTDVRPSP